jgi:hypothetical protein
MIVDPLVPLAMNPNLFAMVPLKPVQMIQTSIFTAALKPESRLIAEFKDSLRQEARELEKRVALLFGNSSRAETATKRRPNRPPRRVA